MFPSKHVKRVMPLLALAFTGMFAATSAEASLTTATISQILVYSTGNLVYVYPTTPISGGPSCGSGSPYYSFSYSRPMANAYLAALLAAQARGATVTMWGTGACTDEPVSETLDYLRVTS